MSVACMRRIVAALRTVADVVRQSRMRARVGDGLAVVAAELPQRRVRVLDRGGVQFGQPVVPQGRLQVQPEVLFVRTPGARAQANLSGQSDVEVLPHALPTGVDVRALLDPLEQID
jgi:hypothetical protein